MEYVTLPGSDLRISRVVLGGWALGGQGWGPADDIEQMRTIAEAIDSGVSCFDTADVYGLGRSEELLSKAVGDRTHEVCFATKFGVKWNSDGRTSRDCSPARLVEALEGSLRRLRRDFIDLYQIHWPDPATPLVATMEALNRCREAGKIRYVGCSNFSRAQLLEARQYGPVVAAQVSYNLLDRRIEGDLLADPPPDVGVLAYAPLAQGLLTGKYGPGVTFPADDVRSRTGYFDSERLRDHLECVEKLKETAVRYGRTPGQVAIRWVLDRPGIAAVVVGARNLTQLAENLQLDWMLEREDHARLAEFRPAAARISVPG